VLTGCSDCHSIPAGVIGCPAVVVTIAYGVAVVEDVAGVSICYGDCDGIPTGVAVCAAIVRVAIAL